MPVKSYKKGHVSPVIKTQKDINNQSLSLAKVFPQWFMPYKANASLHYNAFQYSGAIKACKKFAPSIIR